MKWSSTPIRAICERTLTRDPREHPNEVFTYVDIASIDRDQKAITQVSNIRGTDAPSRARKEIRAGDILVSTVRPNLNAVAIVPPELNGQIASTGFCVLRPDTRLLDGRYLFYFVRTQGFVDTLMSKVRGAHYPAVSDVDVKSVEIPLPSITEQRRIVEILDQADILRKQRADAKAARILPALFYQMFGDPATNPRGWHTGSLGDVFLSTQYGTSTKANSDSEGLPVLRMNNIDSDGFLDLNELKYVVLSEREEEKYALMDGDLLFNRTNSKELVGKTGLWRGELKAVFASYLIRVRIDRDQALPEFIWAYMNSPFMKQVLLNKSRRAIGMANINAKELRQFPLILPPEEQQALFARHLAGLDDLRRWRRRSAGTIESLFQILVHRAFTGRLTARWREAHMKELLQEMEHQTRALA